MKLALALVLLAAPVTAQTYKLVSTRADGSSIAQGGRALALSGNGRFAVFWSDASDVVATTTPNGGLFLKDLQTGGVELVAAATANPSHWIPFGGISYDGRQVCLQPEPWNPDIFVRDLDTGVDDYITPPDANGITHGGDSPSMSADGRYVAFEGGDDVGPYYGWASYEVYVFDRVTRITQHASGPEHGNFSTYPVISADGSTVAFWKDPPESGSPDQPIAYRLNVFDVATGVCTGPAPILGQYGQVTGVSADGARVLVTTLGACATEGQSVLHPEGGGVRGISDPLDGDA